LEEQSEKKGISPTLSKSKLKRIGLFKKIWENEAERSEPFKNFTRSKQNERLRS
jgi:hypothetical protein